VIEAPDERRRPGVSVVVATHNRPEAVRVALRAIVDQSYEGGVHIIVVFDRSEPDEGLEMSSGNRSIRVIQNTRTPGLAGARNTGVLAADAPYVAFCDDDDVWTIDKLGRQLAALGNEPAPTCVTGITVDYRGRQTERIPRQRTFTLQALVRTRAMEAHPSTVLVDRRALLNDIGLIDEEIPGSYGEDFDWMIRALQAGPVRVVESPLVRVVWGDSQFSKRWQTISDAIDYGLAKHRVFHEDPKALARLYGRRAFAQAALGNRAEAIRTAWRAIRCAPAERRSYLAIAVALRLVSADRLMDLAHRRGHGI